MAGKLPDLFGAGEVRVLRLETATGLLAVCVVVLSVMLLWQKLFGPAGVLRHGGSGPRPGSSRTRCRTRTCGRSASRWRFSFTTTPSRPPEAAHERIAQLFHPQLLGVFRVRMAHERELMRGTQAEHAAEHPKHGGQKVGRRLRRPRGGPETGICGHPADP